MGVAIGVGQVGQRFESPEEVLGIGCGRGRSIGCRKTGPVTVTDIEGRKDGMR